MKTPSQQLIPIIFFTFSALSANAENIWEGFSNFGVEYGSMLLIESESKGLFAYSLGAKHQGDFVFAFTPNNITTSSGSITITVRKGEFIQTFTYAQRLGPSLVGLAVLTKESDYPILAESFELTKALTKPRDIGFYEFTKQCL